MTFRGSRAISAFIDLVQVPRPRRAVTGAIVACALVAQACTGVTQEMQVNANDPCSVHRGPMIQAQEEYRDRIAGNAVAGAVVGALLGAAITGDVQGALIGAVAGGLTGAAKGYMEAKQRQAANRQEILLAMNADVNASWLGLNRIGQSVSALNECRAREISALRADIRAKRIAPDVARAQLQQVRARIAADRKLVDLALGEVREANGVYTEAIAKTRGVEEDLIVSDRVKTYKPNVVGVVSKRGTSAYAQAGVNIRSGPGTNFPRVGTMNRGQRVGVVGEQGGWSIIDNNGENAYVSSQYLGPNPPAAQTAEVVLPKVERRTNPRAQTADVTDLVLAENEIAADYNAGADYMEGEIEAELAGLEGLTG